MRKNRPATLIGHPSAQRLTHFEREHQREYKEVYRYRSKAEGTPSRIKRRNPYIRLRRRKKDMGPVYPVLPPKAKLGDQPEPIIKHALDAATVAVGTARENESLAIMIVANLRALIVMEKLLDQRVTFKVDMQFNPPTTWREIDLPDVA